MEKRKARAIIAVRCTLIFLIVLALSGMNIKTRVDTISTIFAVDLSESTRDKQQEIESFIEESISYASKNDKIGIVTFGRNTEIEAPLTKGMETVEFQTTPDRGYTDIEKGLKLSQALLPEDSMKRIVLITDGEENIGNSLNEGNILEYNDIDLKILKADRHIDDEVQLNGMDIPQKLYQNQSFDIVVQIFSNVKTNGKLTLYANSALAGQKEISIEKGNNKFIFKDTADQSGFQSYTAVIDAQNDSITQNNEYSTFTNITGSPNILLIDGQSDGGREIYKLLSSAKLNIQHIKDTEVPHSLSELSKYSTIIMSDVSLENVSTDFLNSLQSYVRDYGGGLVVTGGENSYALGGYYNTPLEEVLPVDMEMKVKGEVPNLGLMLVIDKSGSMEGGQYGISKIEIAKEAAIKAVNSLKPKDKIGVIAFDGAAQWVVNLSSTENENDIKSNIGTIRASGGTSIIPALDEAYKALKDADTKIKHIILLTDGQAESAGYDQLIEDMDEAGITISTVAVGKDSDTRLLEWIANTGSGRYYFVDEFSTIPQIFTKETFLASKAYINNRRFIPNVSYSHEIIGPLVEGIPELDGYIGASVKDRAFNILTSDTGDPILSAWQYGLGRSVAWTSDLNGRWSSDYLQTQLGNDLIKNMIEWTFPTTSSNNISIETANIGGEEELIVRNTGDISTGYETKATIIAPDLSSHDIELKPSKPGEYKSKLPIDQKGVYIAKVTQYKDGRAVNIGSYGIVSNYSKEYDITTSQNRLDMLINKSDGKYITSPKDVFANELEKVYGSKDLFTVLLILALLLLLLDIAFRRLNFRFNITFEPKAIKPSIVQNISKKTVGAGKQKKIKHSDIPDSHDSIDETKDENEEKEKKSPLNSLDTSRLLKAKDKRNKS